MMASLRQILKNNGTLTAQAEKELKQLEQMDIIGQLKKALKSDGYEPNSTATATAAFVAINYGIATRSNLASIKAYDLVRQLSEVSDASLSNQQKQQMAEMLYWHAFLLTLQYTDSQKQGNQAELASLAKIANTTLSQLGLSVSQIYNGANGLAIR